MKVVHLVPTNIGQLGHRLLEYGRVTARCEEQGDPRRGQERGDEASRRRRSPRGLKDSPVRADPKELIADVPGEEGRGRIATLNIDDTVMRRLRQEAVRGRMATAGLVGRPGATAKADAAPWKTSALPPEPASTVVPPEQLRFLIVVNHKVHLAVSVDIVDVQPPDRACLVVSILGHMG